MDGTLLNDRHQISEKVKQTLAKAMRQWIKIVLCSGRPIHGMEPYIDELNLNLEGDYAIAYNGALVQDTSTKEAIIEISLHHHDLEKLYELSLELETPIHFFDTEALYTPNQDINKYTIMESYLNNVPLHYRRVEDIPVDTLLPKIMFINEPEKLNQVIQALPSELNEQYTIVQSAPFFLEFVHSDTSKGFAVKKLAEKLGIKQEEVMTIGDNGNDLSMIKYAGCGVAMANAIPEIKVAADFETLTNNEDGVAHAIEKLVLDQ